MLFPCTKFDSALHLSVHMAQQQTMLTLFFLLLVTVASGSVMPLSLHLPLPMPKLDLTDAFWSTYTSRPGRSSSGVNEVLYSPSPAPLTTAWYVDIS
jgi:hypothetical protein